MATFSASYGLVEGYAVINSTLTGVHQRESIMPVFSGASMVALENLTTSASSQIVQDANVSPTDDWDAPAAGFVTMRANGDVWVSIGANPTAGPNMGVKLFSGERLEMSVVAGDKIAVIDA